MVIIHSTTSTQKQLVTGVPQGSVLGPLLFSMYAQSVTEIIKMHGFYYHLYVDDTQIYKSTPCDNILELKNDLINMYLL